jgi:hypothetical protein
MIDDLTFQEAKVAASAYTMSLSSLIRVALKTFIAGNGFVGARPPIPTTSLESLPVNTKTAAPAPSVRVEDYTPEQQAENRRNNLAYLEEKAKNAHPDDWQAKQHNARNNLNQNDTAWQRYMRDGGITDVSSFSNAKK